MPLKFKHFSSNKCPHTPFLKEEAPGLLELIQENTAILYPIQKTTL